MEEHRRLLELAAGGQLPDCIDEHSTPGFNINIVQELIEAGYLTAINACEASNRAYLQPRITLAGREYLQQQRTPMARPSGATQSPIRLFISHSSDDYDLVRLLLDLLLSALRLPAEHVRCTSIDGYRLPGGANTNEQLRTEVHDAEAFIGVISVQSVKSLYVVFELGARWGAGKPLIPLLAPRVDMTILGGPLSGINALRSDSRPQLLQLVDDIAKVLQLSPEQTWP